MEVDVGDVAKYKADGILSPSVERESSYSAATGAETTASGGATSAAVGASSGRRLRRDLSGKRAERHQRRSCRKSAAFKVVEFPDSV